MNLEVLHQVVNLLYDRILESHEYACKDNNDTKDDQYGDKVGVTLLIIHHFVYAAHSLNVHSVEHLFAPPFLISEIYWFLFCVTAGLMNLKVLHQVVNLLYDCILESHEYACKDDNDTKNDQNGDEVGVSLFIV